jgi:hypothetical protein
VGIRIRQHCWMKVFVWLETLRADLGVRDPSFRRSWGPLVAMFCAPVRDGPELCGAVSLGISSRQRLGAIPPGQFRNLVDGRQ